MTYCSPILLRISRHHVENFQNIQDKAHKLRGGNKTNEWSRVEDTIKINALNQKCTTVILHVCRTANNSMLKLLRVKTESGRKRFKYQRAFS